MGEWEKGEEIWVWDKDIEAVELRHPWEERATVELPSWEEATVVELPLWEEAAVELP